MLAPPPWPRNHRRVPGLGPWSRLARHGTDITVPETEVGVGTFHPVWRQKVTPKDLAELRLYRMSSLGHVEYRPQPGSTGLIIMIVRMEWDMSHSRCDHREPRLRPVAQQHRSARVGIARKGRGSAGTCRALGFRA